MLASPSEDDFEEDVFEVELVTSQSLLGLTLTMKSAISLKILTPFYFSKSHNNDYLLRRLHI